MLLAEVIKPQSVTDWFVDSMTTLYKNAYDRAESYYDRTGDIKVAKRLAGSMVGKWYTENVVRGGQYDLRSLFSALKLPASSLPPILGTAKAKEEAGYSASANLETVIKTVSDALRARGNVVGASRLGRVVKEYRYQLSQLADDDRPEDTEPEAPRPQDTVRPAQQQTAQAVIMDVLKQLPAYIQHPVRTEVARRGNTLQALSQVLSTYGIDM